MKCELHEALKSYLRSQLLKTRGLLNLNQEEMAHRLLMSTRAYSNLESGRSCCSLDTTLIFLRRCCRDDQDFLSGLLDIFAPLDSLP